MGAFFNTLWATFSLCCACKNCSHVATRDIYEDITSIKTSLLGIKGHILPFEIHSTYLLQSILISSTTFNLLSLAYNDSLEILTQLH